MSAISLFEEKQIRRAWNAEEEKWYFSIDDVVLALTGSVNVKDYIKKLRKRDPELDSYWGTNCPPVEMIAADGKKRKMKAANTAKAGTDLRAVRANEKLTHDDTRIFKHFISNDVLHAFAGPLRRTVPAIFKKAPRPPHFSSHLFLGITKTPLIASSSRNHSLTISPWSRLIL